MKQMGFGMMRLPQTDKNDAKSVDQEQVNKMAEVFMEKGFTYFDTAYPYHDGVSEVALKKAVVDKYPRDSYIIADKLPIFAINKEEQLEPIFSEQLERLGVDYFDYYLLHNVSGLSEAGYIDVDSFKFAIEKKKEGKIKHLGLSSHANAEYLDNVLNKYPEMEFIQLQMNYLDWESEAVESRKVYEVARKHDLPVIVMEPLKGGFLSDVPEEAEKLMRDYNGQSPVEWALRFVAGLDGVIAVLSGASSLEQIEENMTYFEDIKPLNDEELKIISKVVDIINSQITVACTKCNYCISSCPKNINISYVFDLYNQEMIDHQVFTPVGNAYLNYTKLEGTGRASDCIDCGACQQKCPQELDIPKYLKEAAEIFETPMYGFNTE
ncbi:aldo/keto reductase [Methanosphaera sp.]